MSEFIDRLAKVGYEKAIASADEDTREWMQKSGINWETEPYAREDWRGFIRAVLTEMRDAVTEEMINAGADADWDSGKHSDMRANCRAGFRNGFRAAIDTALKEDQ